MKQPFRYETVLFDRTLGPVELRFENGHVAILQKDATLLVYDNNGRAAGHVKEPLSANALLVALQEVASRSRVTPQVKVERRDQRTSPD